MTDDKHRILLVEDDEIVAALVLALTGAEAEVCWLPSGEAALAVAGAGAWDLVIADIGLPGMSGLEFVRAFKASHPLVATLILTAHGSFDNAVEAMRADADDFIAKPIDAATFSDKLAELIALTATRRRARRQTVLAVGAHPDDVEIGCGGILLRHVAAGDHVHLLTLTGGEEGGRPAQRAAESRVAAKLLGAELTLAALEDTRVTENGATIATISAAIAAIKPDVVYTHTDHDVHQDHRNSHRATLVAARGVPRVYCFQSPSTTIDFRPTRFVAVDEFVDRKVEVIGAYGSQVKIRRYLAEDVLRATVRYWSRYGQSNSAEPLEVIRESEAATAPLATATTAHKPQPEALTRVS
jgi:LmbE family N-acetylglucosaminyl deacetylase